MGDLNQEAIRLYRASQSERGITVARKALEVAEGKAGPDHPDVATSLENLALLYRATQRGTDAEELEKRASEIRAIER